MKRIVPLIALMFVVALAVLAVRGARTPTVNPKAKVPDSSLLTNDPNTKPPADPFTTPDGQRKQDWLDAIETFAQQFPTYAGYSITPDRKRLILYTSATEPQAEQAEEIHTAFVALIAQTTGFPEATDPQGKTVQVKNLEYVMARVKYPMLKMYTWRIKVRDLMYSGLVNSLSITEEENVINLQIAKESDRVMVMKFLDRHGIPADAVRFKIGVNVAI